MKDSGEDVVDRLVVYICVLIRLPNSLRLADVDVVSCELGDDGGYVAQATLFYAATLDSEAISFAL